MTDSHILSSYVIACWPIGRAKLVRRYSWLPLTTVISLTASRFAATTTLSGPGGATLRAFHPRSSLSPRDLRWTFSFPSTKSLQAQCRQKGKPRKKTVKTRRKQSSPSSKKNEQTLESAGRGLVPFPFSWVYKHTYTHIYTPTSNHPIIISIIRSLPIQSHLSSSSTLCTPSPSPRAPCPTCRILHLARRSRKDRPIRQLVRDPLSHFMGLGQRIIANTATIATISQRGCLSRIWHPAPPSPHTQAE